MPELLLLLLLLLLLALLVVVVLVLVVVVVLLLRLVVLLIAPPPASARIEAAVWSLLRVPPSPCRHPRHRAEARMADRNPRKRKARGRGVVAAQRVSPPPR